jgi:imidazolonepropionase-like amidohydrolase
MKYINRFLGFSLMLLFLISCTTQRSYTIIKHVDIFDGETTHKNMNFVVSDSLIVKISTRNRSYKNSEVIDGQGMTIIPPMLNAHVHVRNPENLQEALKSGIFGLLDMFSTDNRADYLRTYNDSLFYSKFYSSNVGGTVAGGHGTQFGVQIPVIGHTLSGKDFVSERVSMGADYIKITQEQSMAKLSTDQIREIVEEARNNNKKVIGHVSGLADGVDLANNGVDGLAHIWYRAGSISGQDELKEMAEKEVFIIPTLSVIERVLDHAEEIGLADKYLSFEEVKEEVRKAYEAGITILGGTDAPNYGMNYSTQLFEELLLLKSCGIDDERLLKMVTTNIHESFNLSGFGKLEEGGVASFILVEGRPYNKVEDLKRKRRIWKKGIEIVT